MADVTETTTTGETPSAPEGRMDFIRDRLQVNAIPRAKLYM